MMEDQIGRESIVNKITSLIEQLSPNNHFCLALNGIWGSGKSFVLDLIETKILKSDHKEYLIIKYDAWKNTFYPDPLIAILYCILDTLQQKFYLIKDNKQILNIVKQSIKKKTAEVGKGLIDSLYKQGKWAAVCAFAIETIKNVIKYAKSSILDNKLFDDYKSYQTLLSDSIKVLNSITEYEDYEGKHTKLIILVDEIDRCLPNEQLVVLERLHHLFNVKNCAVLVALNSRSITETFNHIYGVNGDDYLRKFFDYNFNLSVDYQTLLKNSLNNLLDEINENQSSNNLLLKEDTDYVGRYLCEMCYPGVPHFNNRECSRLIQAATTIIKKVPNNKMNYCYLWFILIMTFEKLYGNNFNVYKNGISTKWVKIRDIEYSNSTLQIRSTLRTRYGDFDIYFDNKVNHLFFMLNQFIVRNHKDLNFKFDAIKTTWQTSANIIPQWGIKELEQIIDWIDNYS